MNNNKYDPGLVSVSFRQHTPKEIIEAAKNAGLSLIEWGSDIHAPYNDAARLNEIVKLQKGYGIVCSSYGTYFRLGETPIEELEGYINAAKILGTDTLRLWCGRKSGADMTDGERAELIDTCRKAAEIAKENGVKLCMECHRKTFTEDPKDTVFLMESVNSPHFRMYWQPFQWQSAEQNIENAKKIAPYTERIHVFNWKGDKKLKLSGAVSEWQNYLGEFPAPTTLLLEFMPNGTISELKSEADALRSIIGEDI